MHVEVKGADLPGLRALMQRMQQADRSVLIGVPAGKEEADGTPLAMVAAVHEFGSPEQNIPERSFLRAGVREGAPKFHTVNVDSCRKILLGQMTVEQAVNKLGVIGVGEVKRKIGNGPFVPLKPATIKRKGSSRPLIDTGQLRQSITYQLEGARSANAKVVE